MTSITSSLTDQVASVQQQINDALNQAQGGAAKDEIQEYGKTVRKSALNSPATGTDIGLVRKGVTRVNAFSLLAQRDAADYVKFRVVQAGTLKLGALSSDTIRYQLINGNGRVVADNDPTADRQQRGNFDKLGEGTLEVAVADWRIKVSRRSDADPPPKSGTNYSIQLSMGAYSQDYDTVLNQPDSSVDPFAPPQAVQDMTSMLSDMMSATESLPAIGTSATDKLLGQMVSTSA